MQHSSLPGTELNTLFIETKYLSLRHVDVCAIEFSLADCAKGDTIDTASSARAGDIVILNSSDITKMSVGYFVKLAIDN